MSFIALFSVHINDYETHVSIFLEPPLTIRVLLWNINGGEAGPRNLVVPKVVKEVNPDVILLQEIITKVRVEPIIQSDKYGQVFAKDDKESWILFRKEKFTCVSDFCNPPMSLNSVLETCIDKIIPEEGTAKVRHGEDTGWRRAFKNRISIVGLTSEGYNDIVFLSFHNVNSGKDAGKTSSEQFCQIVSTISKQTGCIVIAGADLNYELAFGECHGCIVLKYEARRKCHGCIVLKYEARRKKVIDHFIVAPQFITGISLVEALRFVNTVDGDKLHQLMASLKRQFSRDQYHKALEKGLDKGSDKKILHEDLEKALDRGLEEDLDEVLGKDLKEALGKSLNEALDKGLDKTLGKALYKGLHETLQEALQEALHKDLDEAAHKALDHDPILLEYLHPSAAV